MFAATPPPPPRADVRAGGLGPALSSVLADAGGAFSAAAARMRALAHVSGRHSAEAAADLLEYSVHYGWDHLVAPGSRMPWWAACNADVAAALLGSAAAALGAAGAAAAACARLAGRRRRRPGAKAVAEKRE
jgi:hypothetical protein